MSNFILPNDFLGNFEYTPDFFASFRKLKEKCSMCEDNKPCYKCLARIYYNENFRLRQQISDLKNEPCECLEVSPDKYMYNMKYFKQSYTPMKTVFEKTSKLKNFDITNLYFVTVTFDPKRFGVMAHPEQEKMYILNAIRECSKKVFYENENHSDIYGCFEQHKNGRIHAHYLIYLYTNSRYYIYKNEITSKFTSNPSNKVAVKVVPAIVPNVIYYINKETTGFFKHKGIFHEPEIHNVNSEDEHDD